MKSARLAWVGLLLALIAGTALRLFRLADRSMWFDEAVSFTLIDRFGWANMIERVGQAVHPPLYFITLRLWAGCFGTSLVAMRSLSVVLAGATMLGVYLFCRDGFRDETEADDESVSQSRAIGVVAASFVAVSTFHIAWAQQARMYMLGTALAAFSTWMLVRALRAERGGAWWVGYGLTAAAFMYTHNYALFSVLAQGCFVGGYFVWRHEGNLAALFRSNSFWLACAGLGGAVLLYLPWLPVLLEQTSRVREGYWIRPIHGWTVPNAWFDLFCPHNAYGRPDRMAVVGAVVALVTVLAVLVGRSRPVHWLVVLMIVAPVGCAVALSLGMASIIVPRYFLFAHVFALCAIASVAWRLSPGSVRAVVIGALLVGGLLIHERYWSELEIGQRSGVQGAVQHVLARRPSGERLIVVHPGIYHAVRYYTRGVANPKLFSPSELSHFNGGPLMTREDAIDGVGLEGLPDDKIWVFDTTGFSTSFVRFSLPGSWQPVPGLTASFREVCYFQNEVTVTLYRRSPVGTPDVVRAGP